MNALEKIVIAAAAALAPSFAGGDNRAAWVDDFDDAVKLAKQTKRDLLVDFTGSDWCMWCKRLHEEVLNHDEFVRAAQANFVLVELDYPHSDDAKSKVPNPKRNAELAKQYKVGGYPTVLLMTQDGEVYGRTGYVAGGVEPYVKRIGDLHAAGIKAVEQAEQIAKEFGSAEGDARVKLVDQAIERLGALNSASPAVAKLAPIAHAAFELDPTNRLGRKTRAAKALLAAGELDAEISAAVKDVDAKNSLGLREKALVMTCDRVVNSSDRAAICREIEELDGFGIKDKDAKIRLYYYEAFFQMNFLHDKPTAKKWAQRLKKLAPGDVEVKQVMDQVLNS